MGGSGPAAVEWSSNDAAEVATQSTPRSCGINITVLQEMLGKRLANITEAFLRHVTHVVSPAGAAGGANVTGGGNHTAALTHAERMKAEQEDKAIVYIIVVLMFYSISIVVIMIKYMRAEQREMAESKQYSDYLDYREGKKLEPAPGGKTNVALASIVTTASLAAATGGRGVSGARFSIKDLLPPTLLPHSHPLDSGGAVTTACVPRPQAGDRGRVDGSMVQCDSVPVIGDDGEDGEERGDVAQQGSGDSEHDEDSGESSGSPMLESHGIHRYQPVPVVTHV